MSNLLLPTAVKLSKNPTAQIGPLNASAELHSVPTNKSRAEKRKTKSINCTPKFSLNQNNRQKNAFFSIVLIELRAFFI
jgi:hypothetical protein